MDNVLIDVDAGRKRRLPTWMHGASAVEKRSHSGDKDKKCLLSSEQVKTKATQSKVKTSTLSREEDGSEAKKRVRKVGRRDEGPNSFIPSSDEAGITKKKPKKKKESGKIIRRKGVTSKKKNHDMAEDSVVEAMAQGSSEDDIELTVEDLVSIAEEYVNADRKKQHHRLAITDSNSEAYRSSSSIRSKADPGGSIDAMGPDRALSQTTETSHITCPSSTQPSTVTIKSNSEPHLSDIRRFIGNTDCSRSISRCTTSGRSSHLSEIRRDEKGGFDSENIAATFKTGDVAQDMLDLFLGPLLRKPVEQDARITEITDLALVQESNNSVSSSEFWKEVAPLLKKKSSLKDKVSIFLD